MGTSGTHWLESYGGHSSDPTVGDKRIRVKAFSCFGLYRQRGANQVVEFSLLLEDLAEVTGQKIDSDVPLRSLLGRVAVAEGYALLAGGRFDAKPPAPSGPPATMLFEIDDRTPPFKAAIAPTPPVMTNLEHGKRTRDLE